MGIAPLNLSSLSSLASGVTTASNVVAIIPAILGGQNSGIQPTPLPGASGVTPAKLPSFLFHYEGENKISMKSDVTDHFIENNTSIQDQVSLLPITYTVHGFIGELNNVPPFGAIGAALRTITDKLGGLSAFAPGLTQTMQNTFNQAQQAAQVASSVYNTGKSLVDALGGIASQGAQQSAFIQFQTWWQARQLFTVQTPWCALKNMIIMDVEPTQNADDPMITDFFVQFKQVQFAAATVSTLGSFVFNANNSQVLAGSPQAGNTNPTVSSPLYNNSVGALA